MISVLAGELLSELEPDLVHADQGAENLGLLDREDVVQLLESLVGGERLRLNFVFVCLFVQGQTVTSDRGVDGRAEVCILLDNVTALGIDLDTFASFVHLTENLDTLALDLSECAFLVLCLLQADFLGALSVLLFKVTLALDKGRL